MKKQATIIGLGLIGGSMALDLRASGFAATLVGVDAHEGNEGKALSRRLVDQIATLDEAIPAADVVILAIPVDAIRKVLPAVLDRIKIDAVVIDTGSTKAAVCVAASTHNLRSRFVAAHPIAGTENSGPEAAIHDLFRNKVNIICEREKTAPDAMQVAEACFASLGMHTTFMDPGEHDKHVAYVSHLSHVSSFLLGQTVLDIERDEKKIFNLAGSGLASTVRLAKSSPDMWAPIFEQNAAHLLQALREYIAHLQRFHDALESGDKGSVHEMLTRANEIRRVLQGIELNDKKSTTATIEK